MRREGESPFRMPFVSGINECFVRIGMNYSSTPDRCHLDPRVMDPRRRETQGDVGLPGGCKMR